MINKLFINMAFFFLLYNSNIKIVRYTKVTNDTIILKIWLNIKKKRMNNKTNRILLFIDFMGPIINRDNTYENPIKIIDIK